ncbi:FKBP-type peptidyl-prolyl cis-trans isomerase [Pseudoflavitalea rhizosphaerae]|uniref:FKBP-type peptidyl-prolyl cis-trans isomerase n=1 Tax=Pseudoflavitalea rhizosphaerae TaxID=1884793 RepID=UPI000F8E40A2|nr:FKBP-type peptidyl-prolyl cis-trans isomerase [Pseudoflavitalea rhizosphaerae]
MKRSILFTAICCVALGAVAQTKKPVAAKPAAKPASKPVAKSAAKPVAKTAAKPAGTVVLKNAADSFSYAIGLSLASFYKQQGITDINNALVTKALADHKNGKAALDDMQVQMCIMNHMSAIKAKSAGPNKKASDAFLAENKKRPGVKTTASGLQYEIIDEGTGPIATTADEVRVHYAGTLIDGKEFDSSIKRGQPITFPVTGVIRGWTEALLLMPQGSKWKLYIPSELAYGDSGAGPDIKPGSALIFEVTLLEVIKK